MYRQTVYVHDMYTGKQCVPRHEKDCKPITLPLTRNRELSAADVQYTKPFNTQ